MMNIVEKSAMTLSRVEQNNPDLKPNGSAELSRIGEAIGRNTHLRTLHIRTLHQLADYVRTFADNRTFFKSLKRNAFIENLILSGRDLYEGAGLQILNEYVVDNSSLLRIALSGCDLGNGEIGVLTSAVSRCPNLKSIQLRTCNIDDGTLEELVSGIRGLNQLCELHLSYNNFGRAGCKALATLLQDPNCNLCRLGLGGNINFDDNCATVLANALIGNRKLKNLLFSVNRPITESGWDAFSTVLCDTSSINDTYCSNHTLEDIQYFDRLPANIRGLLKLNGCRNKEEVAVQKIIRYHHHLDMEPFLEWDLKVLPLAVSWFDKARGFSKNDEENNGNAMKLSAMYQFARAVPLLFVPSLKNAGTKRKIDEVNW